MLTLAFLVMELSWVTLAVGLAWIGWAGGAWPPPLVALLPALLGALGARVLPAAWRRHRWYDLYRWGLALGTAALCARAATLLAGLGGLAAWNVVFVAGLVLFWRGWFVGEDDLDPRGVELGFQVGAAAVLILLTALQWSVREAGLGPSLSFFFFGLLAIGLARRGERRVRRAGVEPDWLALIVLLGVATLAVAALLVSLVSPELLAVLADQALWLARSIGALVGALLGWLPTAARPPDPTTPQPVAQPPFELPAFLLDLPAPILWLFARLADALLLGLLLLVVYRLVLFGMRRLRGRRAGGPGRDEGPRSEPLPFSWRGWWGLFWARVWSWARGRPSTIATPPVRPGEVQPSREQRSVRELYRDFLGTAARLGLARAVHQTPAELRDHLAATHPEAAHSIAELTRVYVRARYAQEPIERQQVAHMRAAVDRAAAALRVDSRR